MKKTTIAGGIVCSIIFCICMIACLAAYVLGYYGWFCLLLVALVLLFYLDVLFLVQIGVHMVSRMDQRVRITSYTIRTLTAEAEHLQQETSTPEIWAETKRVYEALRYSDPISGASQAKLEESLQRGFAAFQDAVRMEDQELSQTVAEEFLTLLHERNLQCRKKK